MDNDKIIKISLEFVEMVFKMMESKRTKKTFWVSKTSEKIHKLMEKEKADFKKEIKEKIEGMRKAFDGSIHGGQKCDTCKSWTECLDEVLEII